MADPWDWQDDGFKLDGESPLEITRCLWDELAHSEEDSRSLFSTPLADITTQEPPFYSFRSQQENNSRTALLAAPDGDSLAQRFSNAASGGGNSPRTKRRRLHFGDADPVYENCDTQLVSDSVIESFTDCIDPTIPACSSGIQQQPLGVNSIQTDSFWYRECDDVPAPFGGVETGSHNWIAKSMEEGDNNTKFDPVWTAEPCLPQHEDDMIEGPGTPLPGRSPAGPARSPMYNSDSMDNTGGESVKRKQLSPPPTIYPKSSTPVAYPFTLLKPSETEGDITLKDINQRILMPSSRPVPHVQQQQNQQQAMEESSWSFGGCCSPNDPGISLSGKSVVARTKIHTEGNGTITIMRTRG